MIAIVTIASARTIASAVVSQAILVPASANVIVTIVSATTAIANVNAVIAIVGMNVSANLTAIAPTTVTATATTSVIATPTASAIANQANLAPAAKIIAAYASSASINRTEAKSTSCTIPRNYNVLPTLTVKT